MAQMTDPYRHCYEQRLHRLEEAVRNQRYKPGKWVVHGHTSQQKPTFVHPEKYDSYKMKVDAHKRRIREHDAFARQMKMEQEIHRKKLQLKALALKENTRHNNIWMLSKLVTAYYNGNLTVGDILAYIRIKRGYSVNEMFEGTRFPKGQIVLYEQMDEYHFPDYEYSFCKILKIDGVALNYIFRNLKSANKYDMALSIYNFEKNNNL